MTTLEEELAQVNKAREKILEEIADRNAKKTIACESCETSHPINELTLIQKHAYIEPYGCSGGDYWVEDELVYLCPETKVINRLLFERSWDSDKNSYVSFRDSFKAQYKSLFKQVEDNHSKKQFIPGFDWVNNYYIDKNSEKFGLKK